LEVALPRAIAELTLFTVVKAGRKPRGQICGNRPLPQKPRAERMHGPNKRLLGIPKGLGHPLSLDALCRQERLGTLELDLGQDGA
jgi:hypothetical protein